MTEQRSTVEISRVLGISRNTLLEHMELHGILRRTPAAGGALVSRRHAINERYFEYIDHPDKAYVVGFILGDGALLSKKGRSSRLQLIVAEQDRVLLLAIARDLGCTQLVRERPASSPREQKKVRLVIDRSQMVRDLVAAGVPMSPKSGREPFVRCATRRLTWALLRGVSDADGCIRITERMGIVNGKMYGPYRRARWTITIGRPFIEGLIEFLREDGIVPAPACIQAKPGTAVFEMSSQRSIAVVRDHLYRDGSLWLARKKNVFDRVRGT